VEAGAGELERGEDGTETGAEAGEDEPSFVYMLTLFPHT
jgi:hypothetical protein